MAAAKGGGRAARWPGDAASPRLLPSRARRCSHFRSLQRDRAGAEGGGAAEPSRALGRVATCCRPSWTLPVETGAERVSVRVCAYCAAAAPREREGRGGVAQGRGQQGRVGAAAVGRRGGKQGPAARPSASSTAGSPEAAASSCPRRPKPLAGGRPQQPLVEGQQPREKGRGGKAARDRRRGPIETFDPANPEAWESYAERVEFYLRANKVTDAGSKRDVLLSICGPATFEIAKGLSAPARLTEKSYEEIIRLLTGHFSPQPSQVARRFLFHRRDQAVGESAADYLAALRKISAEFHSTDSTSLQVLNLPLATPDKIKVAVLIEGNPCQMEVDSGSSISHIAEETLRELCPRQRLQLRPANFILRDFQKNPVQIAGWARVQVERGSFYGPLDILVVKRQLATLLGLAWFKPLGIRVEGVGQTLTPRGFGEICQEFPDVFDGSLGSYKGPAISLPLDPTVRPIRLKARRVPFALKPKIEAELDRLTAQGVLEPVDYATWETPIVTPIKPNGEVRICADYKCTINKALQDNPYPVPVVSHVLAALAGSKIFGKLDLAQAYQQLPVDAKTAEAQTIVTHRGAFRVRRLQFGVSVAPGIFQSIMDALLKGIPGVQPFFDDVLVAAPDPEEFGNRLREVLRRFQAAGLKVKREKCLLGVPRVEFLGFAVDAAGIHPTEEKTRAIVQAPAPTCKAELQSFLGVLNFYHSFLPHKAALAEPLHRLLDKKAPWVWGKRQAAAFQAVKDVLVSNAVLHHFDEGLPVILACDASPYGVGAVLGHQLPDGREVPVAYYSRTLTLAERNYAQIDKEALAIVAGVRKFHEYLYGRRFTIATDHKPLLGLLAPDRQTSQILSQRVLRWNQFLNSYTYTLVHRAGKAMGHADALSRLPLPEMGPDPAPAHQVMLMESLPEPPLHAAEVAKATQKHKTLARVLDWVVRGWPEGNMGEDFKPYKVRREELAAHKGCLLWGSRVVIPPPLQRRVLESLHETHPGIVRMKALARSYVWWPGMDGEIESWVRRCQTCQESRPEPPSAPATRWESTRKPWSRLHLDFAGPFQGQIFMIIVDAYTKWLEVIPVGSTTSAAAIRALRRVLSTHGIPDTIVSDNGTAFT
ncbi:uncharacterized protein K02A2.6-like, partial [Heteronotia binoei]|uniref:uncharacterized protein K02A2.6-like n=1 Tax=Heteronotia binoei TaxID=13085 RepID=UPI002931247F